MIKFLYGIGAPKLDEEAASEKIAALFGLSINQARLRQLELGALARFGKNNLSLDEALALVPRQADRAHDWSYGYTHFLLLKVRDEDLISNKFVEKIPGAYKHIRKEFGTWENALRSFGRKVALEFSTQVGSV